MLDAKDANKRQRTLKAQHHNRSGGQRRAERKLHLCRQRRGRPLLPRRPDRVSVYTLLSPTSAATTAAATPSPTARSAFVDLDIQLSILETSIHVVDLLTGHIVAPLPLQFSAHHYAFPSIGWYAKLWLFDVELLSRAAPPVAPPPPPGDLIPYVNFTVTFENSFLVDQTFLTRCGSRLSVSNHSSKEDCSFGDGFGVLCLVSFSIKVLLMGIHCLPVQ